MVLGSKDNSIKLAVVPNSILFSVFIVSLICVGISVPVEVAILVVSNNGCFVDGLPRFFLVLGSTCSDACYLVLAPLCMPYVSYLFLI